MEKEKTYFILSIILISFGIILFGFLVIYSSFYKKMENEKYELRKKIQEEIDKNSKQNQKEENPGSPSGDDESSLSVTSGSGDSLGIPIDLGRAQSSSAGQNDGQKKVHPSSISMNTREWKTYNNSKYGYSFKYPKEFDYSDCGEKNPCKFGQVFEKDDGATAWLSGDTRNQGWPFIIISTANDELHTIPKKKKLLEWLREKFTQISSYLPQDYNIEISSSKGKKKKAVMVNIPQSPQAYARIEIYFEIEDKIFQMQLIDSSKPESQHFYNVWLETFMLH